MSEVAKAVLGWRKMVCYLAFLSSVTIIVLNDKVVPQALLWGTAAFFGASIYSDKMKNDNDKINGKNVLGVK
jgi:FtsH-binding integral membrane protein